MRISTRQTYDSLVNNMTSGMAKLMKNQEMFATGKKLNKPSDDPVGTRQVMDYKDTLSNIDQYQRNIEYAEAYLNEAEAALSGVNDTLARIKELAISEATGTATAQTRASAAIEVGGLLEQLIGVGNSKIGGKYIFAGFKNDSPAFTSAGVYQGDANEAEIEVGVNKRVAYTLTGDDIFKNATDIYQVVSDLQTALQTNDATGIQNSINNLDSGVDQISNNISKIGGRLNRLTVESENIGSFKFEAQKLVSNIEDADFAKLVSEFTQQKTSLEALQQSTGKVLELNIFNYIR